jgi:flagellar biosynthesis protein FlhF
VRFQTITASSMQAALAELRATLGPDAIILSSESACNGNITIRAALDHRPAQPQGEIFPPPETSLSSNAPEETDSLRDIACALEYHRSPVATANILLDQCSAFDSEYPEQILASALELRYSFAPLPLMLPRPVLLFGPSGGGKTLTAAKLAARSLLAGHTPQLITTDLQRAGGAAQLAAYAKPMNIQLRQAADGKTLREILKSSPAQRNVIIDTMGVSAYSADDIRALHELIKAVDCEPVLILPAAFDADETHDLVNIFAGLGAGGMIVTGLDATRRIGSVLGALEAAAMTLHHVSVTPYVANGLAPISPMGLARLLLEAPIGHDSFQELEQASK